MWSCTLAPPGECDGMICPAATMRAVATITVATCQCVSRLLELHISTTWRMRWNDLSGGDDAGCRYHYCSNLSVC